MPDQEQAPLVCCPECGSADELQEYGLRFTNQPVNDLRQDGSADSYDSFDYGDDVIVTGYGCRCGWMSDTGIRSEELQRIGDSVDHTLATMGTVQS